MEDGYEMIHEMGQSDDYEYEDYDEYTQLMAYERVNSHDIQKELFHLASNCMVPIFWQSFNDVKVVLGVCLFLRLFVVLHHFIYTNNTHSNILHCVSCLSGFYVLHVMYHDIFFNVLCIIFLLIFTTYILNFCFQTYTNSGYLVSLYTVALILFGEFFYSDPSMWNRIRGTLLLMLMKIISISIDFQKKKVLKLPWLIEYCGYCLHPGTLIFGPWVSLNEYSVSMLSYLPLTFNWLLFVVKNLIQSIICLLISDCIFQYLFINESNVFLPFIFPFVGNNWMLAYETAVSFHFSHFYISFLATSTSLISGVGSVDDAKTKVKCDDEYVKSSHNDQKSLNWSKFKVTKPLMVEIPRSMLNVVVAWNIPMSKWLRNYVFDSSRYYGDFFAVLFTYAASAMLHGLSFHLAAILLSLGFYTYTEYVLRKKISETFECPAIQARPKLQSPHVPLWAKLFNLTWIVINIMHLTYLGSMFYDENDESAAEGYSIYYSLSKWSQLGYTSHIFAATCFFFAWLL